MKTPTKTELEIEYGSLLGELEQAYNWDDRKKVIDKIDSIGVVIGVSKLPNPNHYNKIKKFYL
jgi:hypothetical protein